MYCAVPSCSVVREDRMDSRNYNRWSSVHSGTFYLVQWYMRMRCTLYQADYPIVHKRTETQSRTFWGILRLVWTFVGNSGHVWKHHSDDSRRSWGTSRVLLSLSMLIQASSPGFSRLAQFPTLSALK